MLCLHWNFTYFNFKPHVCIVVSNFNILYLAKDTVSVLIATVKNELRNELVERSIKQLPYQNVCIIEVDA